MSKELRFRLIEIVEKKLQETFPLIGIKLFDNDQMGFNIWVEKLNDNKPAPEHKNIFMIIPSLSNLLEMAYLSGEPIWTDWYTELTDLIQETIVKHLN